MKRILAGTCFLLFVLANSGFAIEKSELSPDAAALVPDTWTGLTTIILKNGTKMEGSILSETAEKVTVRIKRSATISMTREIPRAEIQTIQKPDAGKILAVKLLTYKLDPKNSLLEHEYKKPIALFDEFLAKCGTLPEAEEIAKRRKDYAEELKYVEKGLAKVDGTWLTPVCAAVKRFAITTEQIEAVSKRPDFTTNPKVKEFHDGLIEKRRVTAKSLPKMMQDHMPRLIENKEFDDAVNEMTAFLHFWMRQVIKSEGNAEDVIKGMDFDYILRMQKNIMNSYKASKPKDERPAKMPSDKDMIYIPGGYFLMGGDSTDPKNDAFPAHIVFVSPFVIDKYEVSNENYRKFVDHVKATGDSSMEHPSAPPLKKHDAEGWKSPGLSKDKQPVVGIDWFDAYAYAKWIGKRLPTEAEWEKAAKGLDQRVFPWGTNTTDMCAANWGVGRDLFVREIDKQIPKPQPEQPSGCGCFVKREPPVPPPPTVIPVEPWDVDKLMPALALRETEAGKFDWNQAETYTNDISAFGLYHMAGNVSEWVNDVYSNDYYGVSQMRDPQGPEDGKKHVYRGGSYVSTRPEDLSAINRGNPHHSRIESGCLPDGRPFIGFRCAKSLSIVEKPVVSSTKVEELPADIKKNDDVKEPAVKGGTPAAPVAKPAQKQPSSIKSETFAKPTTGKTTQGKSKGVGR